MWRIRHHGVAGVQIFDTLPYLVQFAVVLKIRRVLQCAHKIVLKRRRCNIRKTMRKHTFVILFIELLTVTIFALYPSAIDSIAWTPSRAPSFNGVLESHAKLQQVELLSEGTLQGPEDIVMDKAGALYSGVENGDIIRIDKQGKQEVWANTGGRPLGLKFDQQGNLIVCDSELGLLSIDKNKVQTVLTDSVDGSRINFPKSLDIARDGMIYFTDATKKWRRKEFLYDLLETKPNGRLLSYDPSTRVTKVLLDDLYFAHGVALSSKEDFLLVVETWRYRVQKYRLKGPRKGEATQFIGNLPGFPGGISNNGKGQFWLSLISPRNPVLDKVHETPWLKNTLAKTPNFMQPGPIPYGLVLGIKESGPLQLSLHDPGGKVITGISAVQEYDGSLYFGTFQQDKIGKYKL